MNSKEFVQRSGLAISTVRYYEKIGLLPAPARGANNYRSYEERHLAIAQLIKYLTQSGFSLKGIAYLFDELKSQESLTDYTIKQIKERSKVIEQEIAQLTQLKTFLDNFAKETDEVTDFLDGIRKQL